MERPSGASGRFVLREILDSPPLGKVELHARDLSKTGAFILLGMALQFLDFDF